MYYVGVDIPRGIYNMADVRLLLKAKREETRIKHPLAAYSASGQLRCTLCATTVKHASAWQGHLGTKLHRANIMRLKEEEEKGRMEVDKRKAEDDDSDSESAGRKRRRFHDADDGGSDDDRILDTPVTTTHSDRSGIELSSVVSPVHHDTSAKPSTSLADLDEEWAMFQKHVVNALDHQGIYNRASMVAEPELALDISEGLPGGQPTSSVPVANDEEMRRIREHDERELIMDRLMDEEKAQEDADVKVTLLKRRVDAFKHQRRLARANRNGPVPSTTNAHIRG